MSDTSKQVEGWLKESTDRENYRVDFDPFGGQWIHNNDEDDDLEIVTSEDVKPGDEEFVLDCLIDKILEYDSDETIPETMTFNDPDGRVFEAKFKDKHCTVARI